MKIISLNIGKRQKVNWRGQEIETGIYKNPVEEPLFLGKEDVVGDHVVDRRYHGGLAKACYLYSADWYPYWQKKYPDLDWNWGMFGENITLEGLDESQFHIGDVYRLGNAVVQVMAGRQPCFKLGIRFNDQGILKQFIDSPYPGVYLAVLEEGKVDKTDEMIFVERPEGSVPLLDTYREIFKSTPNADFVRKILDSPFVPEREKNTFRKKLK